MAHEDLRKAADAIKDSSPWFGLNWDYRLGREMNAYMALATPNRIIALLDEIDGLRKSASPPGPP